MTSHDEPVVVVIPGDLHLTESELENHRVALWMVGEVNDLIRPDFVQFIGDNVSARASGAPARGPDLCRAAGSRKGNTSSRSKPSMRGAAGPASGSTSRSIR